MPKQDFLVPFGAISGDLQHYPETEYSDETEDRVSPVSGLPYKVNRMVEPVWRDPAEFEDVLRLHQFARGRSAAYFIWKSETTGRLYPMFMVDMFATIEGNRVEHGVVSGRWGFRKSGRNYGIKPLFPKRP